MTDKLLRPGSVEAQKAGCTCPVIDNYHGKGHFGDSDKYGFVVSGSLPGALAGRCSAGQRDDEGTER